MGQNRGNKRLKQLDRYVGIPIVASLSVMPKRRRIDPAAVRRIGFMKTAAIGDALLLSGLLDDTRRAFPGARMIMISGDDNKQAAELLPDAADEHLLVSPRHPLRAIRTIRKAKLDVLLDFGSWPRFDALLAALSGARPRVGFRTAGQFRHFGYDVVTDHSELIHERDNYERLVRAIGVRASSPALLRLGRDARASEPYVVFHPWSGGYRGEVKEWSFDRWVSLGREASRRGWVVVVTGTAREAERTRTLVDRLSSDGTEAVNAAGRYSLRELGALLVGSEMVVSVNTGVAHLAGLSGARTISLEGPTPVARWRPLGPRVKVVESTLPGCGYLNLGFEYDGQRLDCMDGVSVDAVIAAFDDVTALTPNGA